MWMMWLGGCALQWGWVYNPREARPADTAAATPHPFGPDHPAVGEDCTLDVDLSYCVEETEVRCTAAGWTYLDCRAAGAAGCHHGEGFCVWCYTGFCWDPVDHDCVIEPAAGCP